MDNVENLLLTLIFIWAGFRRNPGTECKACWIAFSSNLQPTPGSRHTEAGSRSHDKQTALQIIWSRKETASSKGVGVAALERAWVSLLSSDLHNKLHQRGKQTRVWFKLNTKHSFTEVLSFTVILVLSDECFWSFSLLLWSHCHTSDSEH